MLPPAHPAATLNPSLASVPPASQWQVQKRDHENVSTGGQRSTFLPVVGLRPRDWVCSDLLPGFKWCRAMSLWFRGSDPKLLLRFFSRVDFYDHPGSVLPLQQALCWSALAWGVQHLDTRAADFSIAYWVSLARMNNSPTLRCFLICIFSVVHPSCVLPAT